VWCGSARGTSPSFRRPVASSSSGNAPSERWLCLGLRASWRVSRRNGTLVTVLHQAAARPAVQPSAARIDFSGQVRGYYFVYQPMPN
jgi:hypothetical protein